jgi:hypothetical protein
MEVFLAGVESRPFVLIDWYAEGRKKGSEEMQLYLAGGVSANLKPIYQRAFELYKSCTGKGYEVFWKCCDEIIKEKGMNFSMDLYLAGQAPWKEQGLYDKTIKEQGVSILESFYYADDFTEKMIPFFGKFLLDSGAFTFFGDKSKGRNIKWEEYVDRYADFIVRNDVKTFFELDIDILVGSAKVLELRSRLEKKASRPCIPVWHRFRGKDNFLRMCDEYKYVAIGGIVSKEIKPEHYQYFPWLISEAHKRCAKIHGLGFTALASLPKYHFDSVDSTAWTTGNRFGAVYQFDGKTMIKLNKGEGQKLKDSRAVAINNFNEWVKFQKYAEVKL